MLDLSLKFSNVCGIFYSPRITCIPTGIIVSLRTEDELGVDALSWLLPNRKERPISIELPVLISCVFRHADNMEAQVLRTSVPEKVKVCTDLFLMNRTFGQNIKWTLCGFSSSCGISANFWRYTIILKQTETKGVACFGTKTNYAAWFQIVSEPSGRNQYDWFFAAWVVLIDDTITIELR